MQIRSFTAGVALAFSVAMMPAQQADAAVMVYGTACSGIWVTDSWGNDVCVTSPSYDGGGGGGGGGSTYDGGGGGGGGGGGSGSTTPPPPPPIPTKDAVNPVNNPNKATCKSSEMDRHAHAAYDVAKTNQRSIATFNGPLQEGTPMKVTYDDGGTETWLVTDPYFSDPISPVPVAGSKKCP